MDNPSTQPGEARVTVEYLVAHSRERPAMLMPLDDWEALTNRIASCKVSLRPWAIAYSVAFAVGVTAGLSIIPIAYAQLPAWVLTTYIVICALGLASGAICVISERALAGNQQAQIDDLVADMRRIRGRFDTTPAE